MTVSIVIVNYNTAHLLKECIDSVKKYEHDCDYEFIIVDNKSNINQEKIIDSIIDEYSFVRKLMLDKNYGFAYANNRGAELCNGEYILILNPDVLFVESLFTKLTKELSHNNNIGILGVKLYDNDNRFQNQYYQKPPSILQYVMFYSIISKPFIGNEKFTKRILLSGVKKEYSGLQRVSQLPGAFMFMRKNVYTDFNGFDESFFLFFEDVDLSFRISKKYHLYTADLKVVHSGASSMVKDADYIYGYYVISLINYFRNNYSGFAYFLLKFIIFVNTILKISVEFVKKLFNVNKPGILKVHFYILNNLFK